MDDLEGEGEGERDGESTEEKFEANSTDYECTKIARETEKQIKEEQ